MNYQIKQFRGFTLVELLVVIAIIGILMSMTLAGVSSAQIRSRDARRISDIRLIQSALEQHAVSQGLIPYPPENSGDPDASDYCPTGGSQKYGVYANICFAKFLADTPVDPKSKAEYLYRRPACLIEGTTGTSKVTGRKEGVTTSSGCTRFSESYGLHAKLESKTNPEGRNDSSPNDLQSYDLLP